MFLLVVMLLNVPESSYRRLQRKYIFHLWLGKTNTTKTVNWAKCLNLENTFFWYWSDEIVYDTFTTWKKWHIIKCLPTLKYYPGKLKENMSYPKKYGL